MHITKTRLLAYAGLAVLLGIFALNQNLRADVPPPLEQTSLREQTALAAERPVKGTPQAQVTIVEFSDYQCPYCGEFHRDVLPRIMKDYVDSGKARWVFRNLPLSFHENALSAAQAAECANTQGKYWQMQDMLFDNQGSLSDSNYDKWASELGLDHSNFSRCMREGETLPEIEYDMQYARNISVHSAPTFFINGRPLVGAAPYDDFKRVVDEELDKAQNESF